MRFTRRLFEMRALAILTGAAMLGGLSNCADSDDRRAFADADAGGDATGPAEDADTGDGSIVTPDAGSFDGGPLPVACAQTPCATSLTTTLGRDDYDLGEGFCAGLNDGTVVCWGANGAAQLGLGEDAGSANSAVPTRVPGVTGIVAIDHTCGLDAQGALWCWGTGPWLRDEFSATTTEPSAVRVDIPVAKAIGVGPDVACAVVDAGLLCWGQNSWGQLAPIETHGTGDVLPPQTIAIPAGAPIRQLAVGRAAFAVREDGTVVSWGANPPLARVSSLAPDPYPDTIALAGVVAIGSVRDNACAAAGGTAYCWGGVVPLTSDVGTAPLRDHALPSALVVPEPVVQMATTRAITNSDSIVQAQRWCATTAEGNVYCAGYNANGQSGDGTKVTSTEAVKVRGLPGPVARVQTTPDATCALLTTGKVYCWGSNSYGQLGNTKIKQPSTEPQEVVLP